MDNTNFQTVHQMGNAINNVVRQAMGRDAVQNIDMDYVTVAQRKKLVEETVTGNPASFVTNTIAPLKGLLCNLLPVQDLHGYDHPWPAGGGKNLLKPYATGATRTDAGITATQNADGSITFDGNATGTYWGIGESPDFVLKAGSYIICQNESVSGLSTNLCKREGETSSVIASLGRNIGTAFTIEADTTCYFYNTVTSGTNLSNKKMWFWLETGSTRTEWSPYSNICPISGWTKAKVFVSPTTDEADGTTYTITFPSEAGTVYGGTLDVLTGELVVDRAMVNAKDVSWSNTGANGIYHVFGDKVQASNTAISSHFVPETYSSSKRVAWSGDAIERADKLTIINNGDVQICYLLATPVSYTLTAEQITTLLGQNNIWADTGNVTVMYPCYEEVI